MVANKDESLEVQNAEDTTKVDTIGEEVANSEQQSTSLEQQNNDYSYEAGVQQINNMYDQSAEAIQAEYEQQWQKQRDEYQNTRDDVGKTYWEQQNDLANQYNVARRNMAMNDVANGLNTGTFYNRQESLSNVYYNNNAQLETAKSEQIAELDKAMADLDSEYQKQVNEALANNELERAQKLYDEWNSGYTKAMEKAQILGNYGDFSGYKDLGYSDEEIAAMVAEYNSSKEEVEAEKALERAQTLATYGDFSGYLRAGYTLEETQKMQNAWIMANSQVAYMSGMITEDTYKAIIDGTLNGKFNVQGSYDLNEIAKEIKQERQVTKVVTDVVNNSSELLTPITVQSRESELSTEQKKSLMNNVGLIGSYKTDLFYELDPEYIANVNNSNNTTNSLNLPTSVSSDSLAGQIQRDNVGARTADTTQAYKNRYVYNLAQSYTPSRISSNTNTTLPSAQAAQNAADKQQKLVDMNADGQKIQAHKNAIQQSMAEQSREEAEANATNKVIDNAARNRAIPIYYDRGAEASANQEYLDAVAAAQEGIADSWRNRAIPTFQDPAGETMNEQVRLRETDPEGYWEGSPSAGIDPSTLEPSSPSVSENTESLWNGGDTYEGAKPIDKGNNIFSDVKDKVDAVGKMFEGIADVVGPAIGHYSEVTPTAYELLTNNQMTKEEAQQRMEEGRQRAADKNAQVREDYWNAVLQRDQIANNGMAQNGTPYGSYNATDVSNSEENTQEILNRMQAEKQQNNRDMASQATVTHGATEEQIDRDYGNMIRSGVKLSPAAQTVLEQEQAYIDAEIARQQFMAETQANFERLNALNNWYAQNGYSQTPPENVSDDEVAIVYDAVTGAGMVSSGSSNTHTTGRGANSQSNHSSSTQQTEVTAYGPQYLFNNPNVSNPYAYSLPIAIGKGLSLGRNLASGKTAYYLPQISQEEMDSANALMEETYNNWVASNNTNGGGSW